MKTPLILLGALALAIGSARADVVKTYDICIGRNACSEATTQKCSVALGPNTQFPDGPAGDHVLVTPAGIMPISRIDDILLARIDGALRQYGREWHLDWNNPMLDRAYVKEWNDFCVPPIARRGIPWLRWLSPVSVAEAADIKGQKTELTVQQARQIQAALASLNQYTKLVKDSADKDHEIQQFYSFSPVATLIMAKDGLVVDQALRPVDEAQKKLMAAAGGPAALTGDAEEKFRAEKLQPLLDQKLTLELFRLNASDLAADRQPIRPAVVQALLPILDDDTTK
jgi:hypothetical protein